MRKRLENIVKRMLEGEWFHTNASPRISNAEISELWDLGFRLQRDHTFGAHAGPIAVYPLIKEEFRTKASEFALQDEVKNDG